MPHSETVPGDETPSPRRALGGLALAALGVVYGDIGTSPLYAFKECIAGLAHGAPPGQPFAVAADDVLGLLSLFFWALTSIVSIKYLALIVRADNQGEGGVFALLSLALPKNGAAGLRPFVLAGVFGAALLYADGVLTPSISVLSAVEGLGVATHAFEGWVVPITAVILLGLFLVQRRGTARVGALFGPVMVVWFVTLAGLSIPHLIRHPGVFRALSPHYAVGFFQRHGFAGVALLGAVVLCITGAEALYADIGHFGRRPIQLAWVFLVMPSLLLNYFAQGALLLVDPAAARHPFFALAPAPLLYPLVALSTLATIIASQALITGAFSLTRQAIQLGYLPRLEIRHTSRAKEGQIFVPEVNRGLLVACLALVLAFRTSSSLASAYGLAVTGTMAITTLLFFLVARRRWGWLRASAVVAVFLPIELTFLAGNAVKLMHGAWIPLLIGAGIFTCMSTWKRGRASLAETMRAAAVPLDEFLGGLVEKPPQRVHGTGVFMTSATAGTPPVLIHHLRHSHSLHEKVVLLSIVSEHTPMVSRSHRVEVERLKNGFYRVVAHFGFMQTPRVSGILRACEAFGLHTDAHDTHFYLGREKLVLSDRPGMARWQKALFAFLSRNARPPSDFFHLPADRVTEIGMQVAL